MSTVSYEIEANTRLFKLTIQRDLISTTVDDIHAQLLVILERYDVVQADWAVLNIDLTAAKMVDSLGLNLLLFLIKKAQLRTAKIQATISSQPVYRTFLATRMDKLMHVTLLEPQVQTT